MSSICYKRYGQQSSPCYGCTERHENCHSDCERYGEWKQARDERMEQVAEKKRTEYELVSYWMEQDRRNNRSSHERYRRRQK